MTKEKIEQLKKQFKGKGRIFLGLQYLAYNVFIVNKQFDNKNFSVVAKSESGKSESVLGVFKTKKAAIEFGLACNMKEIKEEQNENVITLYKDKPNQFFLFLEFFDSENLSFISIDKNTFIDVFELKVNGNPLPSTQIKRCLQFINDNS